VLYAQPQLYTPQSKSRPPARAALQAAHTRGVPKGPGNGYEKPNLDGIVASEFEDLSATPDPTLNSGSQVVILLKPQRYFLKSVLLLR
jgi:hypothetical protein